MCEEAKLNRASRRKKWPEMNADERIEFLQKELRRTQQGLRSACSFLDKLSAHEHLNGRIVQRVENPRCESYGAFTFRVEEFGA
jgi:hypothetical protein